jgi:hypothetical protein
MWGGLFWTCLFGVLKASYTWMTTSFLRSGKYFSINLLNMFSMPLAHTSSSMAMISRFGLSMVLQKSCIFLSYFLIFLFFYFVFGSTWVLTKGLIFHKLVFYHLSYDFIFSLSLSEYSNSSTLFSSSDSLSSTWSSLLMRLLTVLFNSLVSFSFLQWWFDFFQDFYIFIDFFFCKLHCLPYLIQLFICLVLEFIQVFTHVVFNFFCHHFFKFIVWDFPHFTIIWFSYCKIDAFWVNGLIFSYFLCIWSQVIGWSFWSPTSFQLRHSQCMDRIG